MQEEGIVLTMQLHFETWPRCILTGVFTVFLTVTKVIAPVKTVVTLLARVPNVDKR